MTTNTIEAHHSLDARTIAISTEHVLVLIQWHINQARGFMYRALSEGLDAQCTNLEMVRRHTRLAHILTRKVTRMGTEDDSM